MHYIIVRSHHRSTHRPVNIYRIRISVTNFCCRILHFGMIHSAMLFYSTAKVLQCVRASCFVIHGSIVGTVGTFTRKKSTDSFENRTRMARTKQWNIHILQLFSLFFSPPFHLHSSSFSTISEFRIFLF